MKQLIILSFVVLLFFLFISCESSKKGEWSSSDIESCKHDFVSEIESDPRSDQLLMISGKTIDDLSVCVCKKLEDNFDSYTISAIQKENISDNQFIGEVFLSCFENFGDLSVEVEDESNPFSANLRYQCRLCKEVTEFICPECKDDLIWCILEGSVISINCPACNWWADPIMLESCNNCDKEIKSSIKHWTNNSGEIYEDCN